MNLAQVFVQSTLQTLTTLQMLAQSATNPVKLACPTSSKDFLLKTTKENPASCGAGFFRL